MYSLSKLPHVCHLLDPLNILNPVKYHYIQMSSYLPGQHKGTMKTIFDQNLETFSRATSQRQDLASSHRLSNYVFLLIRNGVCASGGITP
jgi:hypothetical protein